MMPGMIDPRTVVGDRYDKAIERVRRAIAVDPDYLGCGCCSFYAYAEACRRTGHVNRRDMAAHDAIAAVLAFQAEEPTTP